MHTYQYHIEVTVGEMIHSFISQAAGAAGCYVKCTESIMIIDRRRRPVLQLGQWTVCIAIFEVSHPVTKCRYAVGLLRKNFVGYFSVCLVTSLQQPSAENFVFVFILYLQQAYKNPIIDGVKTIKPIDTDTEHTKAKSLGYGSYHMGLIKIVTLFWKTHRLPNRSALGTFAYSKYA